jgi:hypothetical protein
VKWNVEMKKLVLLILPLAAACSTLQPMVDGVKEWFGDPPVTESKTEAKTESPAPAPEGPATAPRLSYDQAAVECNQEAHRPGATGEFSFCMRSRGWAPR